MNAFATDVYRAAGSLRGGSVQFLDALGAGGNRVENRRVVPPALLAGSNNRPFNFRSIFITSSFSVGHSPRSLCITFTVSLYYQAPFSFHFQSSFSHHLLKYFRITSIFKACVFGWPQRGTPKVQKARSGIAASKSSRAATSAWRGEAINQKEAKQMNGS